MLKEDQTAELLRRCEEKLGILLPQTRGRLKKAEARAAAIWELLVMETAMTIGAVTYEPNPGGSPDICLVPFESRPIWLEVAFLYPRFSDEERQSRQVGAWIHQLARRMEIPVFKIIIHLDGASNDSRGAIRFLPQLHEKNKIVNHPELNSFYSEIKNYPGLYHSCQLNPYSIKVDYDPNYQGPYVTSRGLQQEAPKTVEEHAVFRILTKKANQHKVDGPYVICIGSDQSPALSSLQGASSGTVSSENSIRKFFSNHSSVSAVLVVRIENKAVIFRGFEKSATCRLYLNPTAKVNLEENEITVLQKMDFNRWTYSTPLDSWETSDKEHYRCVKGNLEWRHTFMGIEISVPVDVVIDALAGKKSAIEALQLKEGDIICQALKGGWQIISCKLAEGNIEKAEPSKLVMELTSFPTVFWEKTETGQSS